MFCRLEQIWCTTFGFLISYASIPCTFSDGHVNSTEIIYGRHARPRWRCHNEILSHISAILTTMKWGVVMVLYENQDNMTVTDILRLIEMKHSDVLYTQINVDMSSEALSTILIRMYRDTGSKRPVPVFMVTKSKKMLHILQMADDLDFRSNKTTNYRTNSFWVILSDRRSIRDEMAAKKFNLKHVVLLHCFRGSKVQLLTVPDMSEVRHEVAGNDVYGKYLATFLFPNLKFMYCGRKLVVSTVESGFMQRVGKGGEFKGYLVELFKLMAETLNFTYTYVEPADKTYGLPMENRSWDGLVGQLERYEVDVAVAELTIFRERLDVVDYILPPFSNEGYGVVFKRNISQNRNQGLARIFRSLHSRVYTLVLITIAFVAILLLVTESVDTSAEKTCTKRKDWRDLLKKSSHIVVPFILQLLRIVLNLLGFISIRGDGIQSRKAPTRFLVTFFWIFCIVITGVYIGNLTASLSDTRLKAPFNKLEDLIRLTDWKWGTRGGTLDQAIIQNSNDSQLRFLWKKILKFNQTDPIVLSGNDSVQLNKVLEDGKYGYIISGADTLIIQEPECTFGVLGGIISDLSLSIAVTKDSYLLADLSKVMCRLIDSGILNYLKQRHANRVQKWNSRTCDSKQPIRAMELEDTLGAFLLLVVGVILGTMVLFLERLVHKLFYNN